MYEVKAARGGGVRSEKVRSGWARERGRKIYMKIKIKIKNDCDLDTEKKRGALKRGKGEEARRGSHACAVLRVRHWIGGYG
jgi:hypothetical protein